MVPDMRERGVPVTYILDSDEGHGFGRVEKRRSFTAVVEAFLAKHLGGCVDPVGDDFAGSTIDIKAGRELIPGLGKEARRPRATNRGARAGGCCMVPTQRSRRNRQRRQPPAAARRV